MDWFQIRKRVCQGCMWKVKGWNKIFHANRDQKKAGVAILISDKIDFKTKAVKRDKEARKGKSAKRAAGLSHTVGS